MFKTLPVVLPSVHLVSRFSVLNMVNLLSDTRWAVQLKRSEERRWYHCAVVSVGSQWWLQRPRYACPANVLVPVWPRCRSLFRLFYISC